MMSLFIRYWDKIHEKYHILQMLIYICNWYNKPLVLHDLFRFTF